MNPGLLFNLNSNSDLVLKLSLFVFLIIMAIPVLIITIFSISPTEITKTVGESVVFKALGFYTPKNSEFSEFVGKLSWPMTKITEITQEYKEHTSLTQRIFHTGIDIVGERGKKEEVLASYKGVVVYAGDTFLSQGYANHVIIDHGNGLQTLYAHLSAIYVFKDQEVNDGYPIGLQGNTGHTESKNGGDGTHLHFEVRRITENAVNYMPPRIFLNSPK